VRCGACCRWPGYVRVTAEEVDAIAAFLDTGSWEFTQTYTTVTHDRQSLTLNEREDETCVFLTPDNLCRINPVKPSQCRDFPDKWNFPGFREVCRAELV